jgi:mono/diheme cytochrome c family protein
LLASTGAKTVEEVREDDSPTEVPKPIVFAIVAMILVTLIPGALILNMRNAKSESPRLHVFFDMDFMPSKHTQSKTTIFADGRVQRPPVPGTVARGELGLSDPYTLGYDPSATAALHADQATSRLVSFQQEPTTADAAPGNASASQPAAATTGDAVAPASAAAADGEPNFAWVTEMPVQGSDELFELGRLKFEQNCAVCHGFGGYGDGLVSQRATNLAQGYWLQPTSLHEPRIQQQPVGKLYYTVANGKGKMGGYAASLTPEERWAVVFYVRALQRSQNAKASDVPAGVSVQQ